jgi:iron complex transport system substrate-binding protein
MLGPGLLETVYDMVLAEELRSRGLKVDRARELWWERGGVRLLAGRVDQVVEDQVVVELKSLERLALIHGMQLLTYLRLLDLRVGLLINFGMPTLKQGLRRIVNDYIPPVPSASQRPPRLPTKHGGMHPRRLANGHGEANPADDRS